MPKVYFPWLAQGDRPHPQPEAPVGSATAMRYTLIALWTHAPWQRRARMVVDDRLMAAAQAHAEELRYRERVLKEPHGYSLHRDLQGRMPNRQVRAAGYRLPAWYPDDLNMVQSVGVTHQGPEAMLAMLYASPGHTAHMAGLEDWLREQEYIGVGFAPPAWGVFVTAPAEA